MKYKNSKILLRENHTNYNEIDFPMYLEKANFENIY